MRNIKRFIFILIILLGVYFFIKEPAIFERETRDLNKKDLLLEKKDKIQNPFKKDLDIKLDEWLGKTEEDVIESFGQPNRVDLSEYNYESYVYKEKDNNYLVFGIDEGLVVTIFGTGNSLDTGSFQIGDSFDHLASKLEFEREISLRKGASMYTIQLNEDDLSTHPLVPIDQNTFAQFYFDRIDNHLIAIRILNSDTLLRQGGFDVTYRGKLPKKTELTDEEFSLVERAKEMQTVEITNTIRNFYGLGPLQASDVIQSVAYSHSKDMVEEGYFSHVSKSGKNLANRLSEKNISYQIAGENIASNYVDALATVLGWLNSEGHREALLNEQFTHIGVGVYENHFTQNFIKQ